MNTTPKPTIDHNPRLGTVTYKRKHPLIPQATTATLVFCCVGDTVMYAVPNVVDAPWTVLCAMSDVIKFEEAK